MALGEAAGVAAALSLEYEQPPRALPPAALQFELIENDAVLMYYRDASPGDPAYDALQFFGVRGFVPSWHAELDEPVSTQTASNWRNWTGVSPSDAPVDATRGELLAELYTEIRERPIGDAQTIHVPSDGGVIPSGR